MHWWKQVWLNSPLRDMLQSAQYHRNGYFVWLTLQKTVFVLLLFARECYTDFSQQRGQRTQRRIVLFSQTALVFVWVFGDATKAKPIKLAEWGLQYFVEHFGTELGTTNRLFPEECEGPHSGGGQHTPNSIEHHHHHHVLPIFWGKSNFLPGYGGLFKAFIVCHIRWNCTGKL